MRRATAQRAGRARATPAAVCLALALAVLPVAVLGSSGPADAQAGDAPPPQALTAATSMPPGQSGFISLEGQARGQVSGNPDDFGPHIDDQREMHWSAKHKPAGFHAEGAPQTPKAGVRIYRDSAGVPAVYADSGRDVWWGAGYAAATDRLFLLDGVRRTARGTLAELSGPGGVPADVQMRVLGYTEAELTGFLARMSQQARDAFEGYAEGVNARIDEVLLDPRLLPAEYALLTSVPAPVTPQDLVAAGVYIARYVAAEGGNEMRNVTLLRDLEARHGKAQGRALFQDLTWQDDPKATVSVPASEGVFRQQSGDPVVRQRAFDTLADYAATLPAELTTGAGTGAYPVPASPAAPAGPGKTATAPRAAAVTKALAGLEAWRRSLKGGSWGMAIAPSRTKDGKALLVSAPQLPFSYPPLLWELEIHGGGYDARGATVPGLPVVGIGYGERTAWAWTSGYSKTIDSFIETTRREGGRLQHLHRGQWKDAVCRTETVRYRAAPEGVPVGPPVQSAAVEACRTVHGPVVATTSDGTLARAVEFHMWDHEVDTVEGVLEFDRVDDFAGFEKAMRKLTLNENVMYADADGRIAYWHPGRHLRRRESVDQRFPLPGDGSYDSGAPIPFDQLPHVVDPAQGYVANWNNKPAVGWLDGEGLGSTSRPGGVVQRKNNIDALLRGSRLDFAGLPAFDLANGSRDVRTDIYVPLLQGVRSSGGLTTGARTLLDVVLGCDRTFIGPGAGSSADFMTSGTGPAAFQAVVDAVRAELFGTLPESFRTRGNFLESHKFDATTLDNLALQVLAPGASGLRPRFDYLGGRTRTQVISAALAKAYDALVAAQGADPASWRRPHPRTEVCSLTDGVIGPCLDMPYYDRGTYVHLVGFTEGPRAAPRPRPRPDPIPATGAAATTAALAVLASAAAVLLRRRGSWRQQPGR